jgi:hypothetical protein
MAKKPLTVQTTLKYWTSGHDHGKTLTASGIIDCWFTVKQNL